MVALRIYAHSCRKVDWEEITPLLYASEEERLGQQEGLARRPEPKKHPLILILSDSDCLLRANQKSACFVRIYGPNVRNERTRRSRKHP